MEKKTEQGRFLIVDQHQDIVMATMSANYRADVIAITNNQQKPEMDWTPIGTRYITATGIGTYVCDEHQVQRIYRKE